MSINKLKTLCRLVKTSLFLSRSVTEKNCPLNQFLQKYAFLSSELISEVSLDLGSGSHPANPFKLKKCIGIDLRAQGINVVNVDLSSDPIPFENNSIGIISAFHFLEHVPRISYTSTLSLPFINLMNEVYRSLEANGLFLSVTPAFPFQASFSDPTHVNHITEKTFRYYFSSDPYGSSPMARMYGFTGNFTCIEQVWDGESLITLLKKTV